MQGETNLEQEREVEGNVSVALHNAVLVLAECLHCKADQSQGINKALSDEETDIVFELILKSVLLQRVSHMTLPML